MPQRRRLLTRGRVEALMVEHDIPAGIDLEQVLNRHRADVIAEVSAALRAEYDGGNVRATGYRSAADFIERKFRGPDA